MKATVGTGCEGGKRRKRREIKKDGKDEGVCGNRLAGEGFIGNPGEGLRKTQVS